MICDIFNIDINVFTQVNIDYTPAPRMRHVSVNFIHVLFNAVLPLVYQSVRLRLNFPY